MAKIDWEVMVRLGDPLVKGVLHARYMGYKRWRCGMCKKLATHVIVVPLRHTKVTGNLCQHCYYNGKRAYDWKWHGHYNHPTYSWDRHRKEAA